MGGGTELIAPIASVAGGMLGGKGSSGQDKGYREIEKMLREAMTKREKIYEEGKGYMMPFYQSGQRGLAGYEGALGKFSDPTSYINKTMESWKMSPGAKMQMDEAMKRSQMTASGSGMQGSGAQMKGIADYSQQLVARDQQNWLNNILGIDKTYLGGMGDLMGQGFGATQKIGDWGASYGDDLMSLLSGIGASKYGQSVSKGSAGNIIGGGLGAIAGRDWSKILPKKG